jgi:hypothetical protein
MSFFFFAPLTHPIQDRLLPENFVVPAWKPPSELDLANAPAFSQKPHKTPKKSPAPLSTIDQQPDDNGSTDSEEDDDAEGEPELLRPATPTPLFVFFVFTIHLTYANPSQTFAS